MKINACVMAMGLLMGFGTVAFAQSPQGFLLSNYERQGAVSRVDAATSTVWIDGKPYKVNAQARLYVGVGADMKAVGRLSEVPAGGIAGIQLDQNGTVESLWFRSKEPK